VSVVNALSYYGIHIDAYTVVLEYPPSAGARYTLADLARILEANGATAVQCRVGSVRTISWDKPVILHSNYGSNGHFAVLMPGALENGDRLLIYDAGLVFRATEFELSQWRSGAVLLTSDALDPKISSAFPVSISLLMTNIPSQILTIVLLAILIFVPMYRRFQNVPA
jgi:hypothetical protein